ncbi:hypothetical protein [uncultured Dokdonia sp.]|uniref:hypothetical protein n=1 Tax=uncultured Dokdonia sp. TaxID=575653 RepID=UPI0026399221|nr:hypothetical protein [uncultured Dokdonia sp.]
MKKSLLTLVLIVFVTLSITAQQQKYRVSNFYEGYIITKDGNKEKGYILYQDETVRYKKVVFKKERKGKKQRFSVKDIKGYKVAGETYHAIQYKDVVFKQSYFLLLEKEGCINTYKRRDIIDGEWQNEMILSLDGDAISTQTFALGFAKKLSAFIKDNKELAAKVKNKEKGYRLLSLEAIIAEYNEACTSK